LSVTPADRADAKPRSMTLANQLTMARFVMALATFGTLMAPAAGAHLAALALFVAATVTDWIDGYIARSTGTISPFGKVADPIADKILVIGALLALSRLRFGVPHWAVFLIIARELLMGGIRVLTITQQGSILSAQKWGKISMVVQSVAVIVMILLLVVSERWPVPAALLRAPYFLTLACVAVAWLSAYLYVRQARKLLEKSWV
jgi:CDP-diacylglycerol--glycerol-3-phosphate 3-phosphatidyltransferase